MRETHLLELNLRHGKDEERQPLNHPKSEERHDRERRPNPPNGKSSSQMLTKLTDEIWLGERTNLPPEHDLGDDV